MGIRYIGPGQTYPTIQDANVGRSGADSFVCRFDTEDASFMLSTFPTEVVADDGYTPAWVRAGVLCTTEAGLIVEGLRVGRSDIGSSYLFGAAAQTTAGLSIELRDCQIDVVGGSSHAVAAMTSVAVGIAPLSLSLLRCAMAAGSARLNILLGVAGASGTKLGRGYLSLVDCPSIETNGLRSISANGLFDEQELIRSIIRIYVAAGASNHFAAGAVSRIWQSVLDGMDVANALVTADLAAMTLDIKSSYICRSAGTAILITNPAGQPIRNSAIQDNATAGINSAANITVNCLFGNNGADYAGGGALDVSDVLGTPSYVDRAAGDYEPTADSDTIDDGTDEGFGNDIRGQAIPWGAGPDIGPFEFFIPDTDPPEVTGAVRTAAQLVRVSFSEAMDTTIASLTDPASWTFVDDDGDTVSLNSITVETGDASVLMDVATVLQPGMRYTVTAPADLQDVAGNVIDGEARVATFIVPWTIGRLAIRQASGQATVRVVEAFENIPETAEV